MRCFWNNRENHNLIHSLIKKSLHRGPDASSIWSNDKVTLGHNLLSITASPEDGVQPYITKKGMY